MRLIDADALKREMLAAGAERNEPAKANALCSIINSQPTINICSKWILANRPPEIKSGERKRILISFETDDEVMIGQYAIGKDGKGDYIWGFEDEWITFSEVGMKVNGWMPVPEPYKEEK